MLDKLIDLIIEVWDQSKPYVFILEYEEGVMFRAGRFLKILKPGWHLKIPFIDNVMEENVKSDTMEIPPINITTLDGKTISIGGEFNLAIDNIYLALVETNDWRSNLKEVCRGILSDHLEDCEWGDIKKKIVKNQISKRIEKRAEEMGIKINNFNYTDKVLTRALTLFKGL